jgi:hypothetical protein
MDDHAILIETASQFHWPYCRCGWCGMPTTELTEADNEGLDHYHSTKGITQ